MSLSCIALFCYSERAGECLSLSKVTLIKYSKKFHAGEPLLTPGKERTRERPQRNIDEFTRNAIRRKILSLHKLGTYICYVMYFCYVQ